MVVNRRQFLANAVKSGSALTLGGVVPYAHAAKPVVADRQPYYTLPEHLPKKLSIGMFIWNWVTMATPGEPYHDLDKAVSGLAERGFNAVRVEAGLNWCFDINGQPRGEMEFGPWISGYQDNLTSVHAVGGGKHDVLKRVVRLLELAQKHGIYVILTSWEYQDSSWFVADKNIRAQVMGVPKKERFLHMAGQLDRLLRILKEKGLHQNIAFVEIHNEPEYSLFPKGKRGKQLYEEAITFLRDAHDDILVSGDSSLHDASAVPDNVQVYDQHTYTGLYTTSLFPQTVWHKDFDPTNPRKNELLQQLLKEQIVPYQEFQAAASNIRPWWIPIQWLYYNLDNQRFDAWIAEQYRRDEVTLKARARQFFEGDAKVAARRGIPAVCDEGGYF